MSAYTQQMYQVEFVCLDCAKHGHASKKYFKCKMYEVVSANDGNFVIILLTE